MNDIEKKLLETCVDYLSDKKNTIQIRETLMTMYETGVRAGVIKGMEKSIEMWRNR